MTELFALSDLVDLRRVRATAGDALPGLSSAAGTAIGGPNARRPSHNGIDIRMERGAPVYAPCDVAVRGVLRDDTNGNGLVLEVIDADVGRGAYRIGLAHLAGIDARIYAHHMRALERVTVRRGDLLGFAGSTGRSTGPHIHLTITDRDGRKVDPCRHIEWDLTP